MPNIAETQYGRIICEEAGHPEIKVQAGETINVIERFKGKIQYYNQALNVHLTVESNPQVQDIAISDGIIKVNPETAGGIKNEDFLLLHECAHDKQKTLLGFPTTEELINSFSQDLTTTELGARDWVEKYTMPPFVVSHKDQPIIFNYYSGELRTSLARGIRDVHSDVIALRNRKNIYLTDKEREDGIDSEEKFFSQFHNELTANVPRYDYHLVQDTEPDFIRKISRFKAVAAGSAQFFKSDGLIVEKYDAYMKTAFGENSQQYQVYTALSRAYQTYFLNCTQRTELIDPDLMITTLDSENPLMRARATDFLGEVQNASAIEPMQKRLEQEHDKFVRWYLMNSMEEILFSNLDRDVSWAALDMLLTLGSEVQQNRLVERLSYVSPENIPKAVARLENVAHKIDITSSLITIGRQDLQAIVAILMRLTSGEKRLPMYLRYQDLLATVETSSTIQLGLGAKVIFEIAKDKPHEAYQIAENFTKSDDIEIRIVGIQVLSRIGMLDLERTLDLLQEAFYVRRLPANIVVWNPSLLERCINNYESIPIVASNVICAVGFIGKVFAHMNGEIPKRILDFLDEKASINDPLIASWVVNSLRGLGINEIKSGTNIITTRLTSILKRISSSIDNYPKDTLPELPDEFGPHLLRLSCAKAVGELFSNGLVKAPHAARLLLDFYTEHVDLVLKQIGKKSGLKTLNLAHEMLKIPLVRENEEWINYINWKNAIIVARGLAEEYPEVVCGFLQDRWKEINIHDPCRRLKTSYIIEVIAKGSIGQRMPERTMPLVLSAIGDPECIESIINYAKSIAEVRPDLSLLITRQLIAQNPNGFDHLFHAGGIAETLGIIGNVYPEKALAHLKQLSQRGGKALQAGEMDANYCQGASYIAQALKAIVSSHPEKARKVYNMLFNMMQRKRYQLDSNDIITAIGSLGVYIPDVVFPFLRSCINDKELSRVTADALIKFASPAQLNQILSDPSIPSDSRDVLREYLTKTN